MASLNLDVNYFDHFKTKRLIGLLGRGAELLPIKLWAYCGKIHADTGRLEGYTIKEIESILGWEGEPGRAIQGLIAVGFIRGSIAESLQNPAEKIKTIFITDWANHQGHLKAFKERSRRANRVRWAKYRRENKDSLKESLKRHKESHKESNKEIKESLTAPPTIPTILTNNPLNPPARGTEPSEVKPYEIKTPLQKVVVGWKMITGYEKDDRQWDAAHWSRTAKSAQVILDFFTGDYKVAVDCCQAIREQMEKSRLTCTIETVIKHMADWKMKRETVRA